MSDSRFLDEAMHKTMHDFAFLSRAERWQKVKRWHKTTKPPPARAGEKD